MPPKKGGKGSNPSSKGSSKTSVSSTGGKKGALKKPAAKSSGYGPPPRSGARKQPPLTGGQPLDPFPINEPPPSKWDRDRSTTLYNQSLSAASVAFTEREEKPRPAYTRVEVTKTRLETPFVMPALSTHKKQPKAYLDREALKKKMFRRQAPEGEDIKKLREILKGIKSQDITVQEFVGLVSPYTGDNGSILRKVMAEDINGFRIMAKKIYDTMTQDVSDVLTNEHVQLIETQNEKYEMYMAKMMRAIDEIFELFPDFDFEKYYQNPNAYLISIFPIAKAAVVDSDEEEMQLRQEAYHRLQWLRSEGDRLAQENARLQARLKQLKYDQKNQIQQAEDLEYKVEEAKAQLEATEACLQDKLDDINTSIDKSMVFEESAMRRKKDSFVPDEEEAQRGIRKEGPSAREGWNKKAAVDIEADAGEITLHSEISKVSLHSKASCKAAFSRRKVNKNKTKPKAKVKSPHFSPIKTPPSCACAEKARSPFHFSPPKTPPGGWAPPQEKSPFHYSPPRSPSGRQRPSPPQMLATTKVEKTTTITEQAPACPPRRRGTAPRDSWGGYY